MDNYLAGTRRSVLKTTLGSALAGLAGTTLSGQAAAQEGDGCVQVDLIEITESGGIKNPVSASNKYNDENRLISWLWGNWDEQISGEDGNNLPYESQTTSCTIEAVQDIDFDWDEDVNLGVASVEIELAGCDGESPNLALVAYDAPCGSGPEPGWNGSDQYTYSLRTEPNTSDLEGPDLYTVSTPSEPPVTDGLAVHLDAGRIDASDGDDVDTWPDLSGNGNDAVAQDNAPSFVLEPDDSELTFVSPGVKFDQTNNEWMTLGDGIVATVDNATVLLVYSVDTTTESHQLIRAENSDDEGGFGFEWDSDGEGRLWAHYGSDKSEVYEDQSSGPGENNPHVSGVYSREGKDDVNNEYNNKIGDHTPYGSPGELYLGADPAGDPGFSGNLREVIVYDRGLTDTEVQNMGEYIRVKHTAQVLV